MISLTYADVPLLLETPEIRKFVRAARPPGLRSPRWRTERGVQYSSPPAPRINTLYWPTGAGRWAYFFGLAEASKIASIVAQAASATARLQLAPDVQPAMRLLPPQPMGCRECSGCAPLWLITLVDDRYFWNRQNAGELIVSRGDAWEDLIADLAAAAGCELEIDPISSAYLHPDPATMSTVYENPAALLDAAAEAVGQRIVVSLDGDVRAMNWTSSQSLREQNLAEDWPLALGGDRSDDDSETPEKAIVSFPVIRHLVPSLRGERYRYEKTPPDGLFPDGALLAGAVERIASTAYADFTGGDSTPDNDAELDALAEQIAADYYASRRFRTDSTYVGFPAWRMNGCDDYASWTFDDERGPLLAVHSLDRDPPPMRQQSDRTVLDTTIKKGVADESLTIGGSGDVVIYENGLSIGESVSAHLNWMHGGDPIAEGTELLLQYFHEENAWVVIGAECS